MMYLEFTVSQTMEHFLACHQNAFAAFGGVPKKIMVDNLMSAVLKRALGQQPVLNPTYIDFANHYGFIIAPCSVRKANEKGRVENAVGYVKKNFHAGLELPDYQALNNEAQHWLDTIVNVRMHGETKRKPVECWVEEKQCMLSLPANTYDIGVVTPVRPSTQFRITIDTNHYSVPSRFAGMQLTLKTYPDRLCVYDRKDMLVARHTRSYDRNQDFEDPDHVVELLTQCKKTRAQAIYKRFLAISPRALAYCEKLEKRRLNHSYVQDNFLIHTSAV